jgi:hypothetical protein
MCDYSLLHIRSRPAKVDDKLTTRDFGTGTRGFAAAEDAAVAVCVLPGTELAFSRPVTLSDQKFIVGWKTETIAFATAIFRQVNTHDALVHHDALEFPNGRIVLLTKLAVGQEATVLQLPAQPMTVAQKPLAYVR